MRAVLHGKMDILVRGLVKVFEVGQRRLTQIAPPWHALAELEQLHAEPVPAIGTLQSTPRDELGDEPVRGGLRQPGPGRKLGQRQGRVGRLERVQQPQPAREHGLRRTSGAGGHLGIMSAGSRVGKDS